MHIDWFVLFCQIFNFLLLVYLLKRFLFWRIIKAIDEREARIAASFSEAQEIKAKAAQAADLYEKKNKFLAEKSEQLLNEANSAAEARKKELMEKVREEVDSIKIRWQTMLAREKEAFFQDLRVRAAREIYATARKAMRDLADADLEAQIVNEFIRRVRSLDKEKTGEIRKAISGGGNKVVVQSAFDIDKDTQAKIEQALKKQITNGFTIRYMTQPDVVSGIELRVNGHKIAWSLNEYLENLVENLTETIQKEAHIA
ncbi:MAG TPA: hypothetical protein ENN23_11060 [Deltaproteobacteria bacterium]|nr:hypothetical protein [Deltaproteobacteria bacterium]